MPFVVRPKAIFGTPKHLSKDLGWKLRFYPNPDRANRMFDYRRDFFTTPVKPQHVNNGTEGYNEVYNFAVKNKYGQRQSLAAAVPAPNAAASHAEAADLAGDKFVVRPLRHSGGLGYRVTQDRLDFVAGTEYISELFRKRREYRVIFVFGKPIIWLRKKPHDTVDEEAPWGAANSSFQTINDVSGCRLAGTDVVARLSAYPGVQSAHICAADILYNSKLDPQYAVLELNFCPGIDIDTNRAKIVEVIRAR